MAVAWPISPSPTTGYLAGFVVAAGLTGWAADRGLDRNAFKLFAVNLAGTAIILLLGAAWIAVAFGTEKALAWGVGPFIATDVIKAALAAAVVPMRLADRQPVPPLIAASKLQALSGLT